MIRKHFHTYESRVKPFFWRITANGVGVMSGFESTQEEAESQAEFWHNAFSSL